MINLFGKTDDFIKMINYLSKTHIFTKNIKFVNKKGKVYNLKK